MRLWIILPALLLLAAPAKADYVGVADGFYGDQSAPSAASQPGDYVGVADGFLAAPASGPIPLTAPSHDLPVVTITPPPLPATVGMEMSEGNFTFVPEGAAPPPAPLPPALTAEQQEVANNYPVNTYDGAITNNHPVMKDFNTSAEVSDLPALNHGDTFKGRMAVAGNGPRTVTVNNNADWIDLWHNQIGTSPPGRLDRGQKAVVVFDASHAYSGYAAEAVIEDESDGRIIVAARHIAPSQRSAISPEASAPYAAIVLDASGKTLDVRETRVPSGV